MSQKSSIVVVAHPILFTSGVIDTTINLVIKMVRNVDNARDFDEILENIQLPMYDAECCRRLRSLMMSNIRVETVKGWICEVYVDSKRIRSFYINGTCTNLLEE